MKMHWVLGFLLAFLFITKPDLARAQPAGFTLRFDEDGNGFVNTGTGFVPSGGVLRSDPTGGVAGPVLTYFLPNLVNSGDILVLEFAESSELSDVVRFTNVSGVLDGGVNADRFIFYSDLPESGEMGALADTGFPTTFSANRLFIGEVGIEGNNGFMFTRSGSTFIGMSDAVPVPEPKSFVVLGLGALGLLGYASRRREQIV